MHINYSIICHSFQIVHLRDFAFWKIFHGLTVEEIRKREESFDYPPRLQIECEQIDDSKPLYSSFTISKKHSKVNVAEFSLIKKVAGNSNYNKLLDYKSIVILIYLAM